MTAHCRSMPTSTHQERAFASLIVLQARLVGYVDIRPGEGVLVKSALALAEDIWPGITSAQLRASVVCDSIRFTKVD